MIKKSKNFNYYKISTFILGGIILLFAIIFLLNIYIADSYQKGYLNGEQAVFSGILENLEKDGYVSFGEENTSITLVSIQMLQTQKEQTILEIMKQAELQGFVELYNNEAKIILVPFEE